MVFSRFYPKATHLPSIFRLASIWSCKAASKSEAPLIKVALIKKFSRICYTSFKIFSKDWGFLFEQLHIIKLNSEPLTLRRPCSSRLRPNKKMLCWKTFNKAKLFTHILIRLTLPMIIVCSYCPCRFRCPRSDRSSTTHNADRGGCWGVHSKVRVRSRRSCTSATSQGTISSNLGP